MRRPKAAMDEARRVAAEALADGLTPAAAAGKAGVHLHTLSVWMAADPSLAPARRPPPAAPAPAPRPPGPRVAARLRREALLADAVRREAEARARPRPDDEPDRPSPPPARLHRNTRPPRPAVGDRYYDADEWEFMRAAEDFKSRTGNRFPTLSDLFGVFRSLGYAKPPSVARETA